MKDIHDFLKHSGFDQTSENSFTNSKCKVTIIGNNTASAHYEVKTEEGSMYSNDINIYWLIGVLTYYNYIDRNYTTPWEHS